MASRGHAHRPGISEAAQSGLLQSGMDVYKWETDAVMTDSEHQYETAKASLLAEERKLVQVLSANPFFLEVQEARERLLERIENDDGTITEQELTFTFAVSTVRTSPGQSAKLVFNQIRDQDRRCAPLRQEWYALLRNRKPD